MSGTTPLFWFEIAGVILAGIGLAFTSLIETAMVSVSRIRMRQLADEGHPTAPLVIYLHGQRQQLLGSQVVLINIFVLLAANLTTAAARLTWGVSAVVWANLIVLFGMLAFGEITPKTISIHFAENVALRTARAAYLINLIFAPVVAVLNAVSFAILRIFLLFHILPGQLHPAPTAFSEEDIKDLVSAGEQSGEVEASERAMIHGVIEFSDTTAREIMVPRTDLVALPVDVSWSEAIETFLQSGHSRIPVYEENTDNILGLLYVKDLLIQLNAVQQKSHAELAIAQMLRPAYFVPETKKSDELLREMQRKRVHMAIVVDEYGGTAGVITIEDLLEEIVGDIIDEYDQEEDEVTFQADGSAMVSGRASLEKIHESLDMAIPEETDAETISGLITEQLGRIPEAGDEAIIAGVKFTVLKVSHNRIERLLAVALPSEGGHNEQAQS